MYALKFPSILRYNSGTSTIQSTTNFDRLYIPNLIKNPSMRYNSKLCYIHI